MSAVRIDLPSHPVDGMSDFPRFSVVLFAALVIVAVQAGSALAAPSADEVRWLATSDGIDFVAWGGQPDQPSPTLIVLSGVMMESLTRDSFLRAGRVLGPKGYLCVSLDLPDHGALQTPEYRGVPGWAKRAAEGEDFVAAFNARLSKLIDYLIAQKLADPERIVVTGTSRGGFLAIHYMAFDARVKAAVAYAPPVDLRNSEYFKDAKDAPLLERLPCELLIPRLVGRPIAIFIGDRDDRVHTDAVISFARQLSVAATAAGVPSRVDLHVLSEPRGHSLPAGVETTAAQWIHRTLAGKPLP